MKYLSWVVLFSVMLPIRASVVQIDLHVSGPGAVRFGTPRPHEEGSKVLLIAEPLGGARFLHWDDGFEQPEREVSVDPDRTAFTAVFEWFQPPSQRFNLPLTDVDPDRRPMVELRHQKEGFVEVSFELAGRHGFRLESSSDLIMESFTAIPFLSSPDQDEPTKEGAGGPGRVTVWAPLPDLKNQGFYRVFLDNGLTIPILLYADVLAVAPGAEFEVHGINLKNPSVVSAGTHILEHRIQNSRLLKVLAPLEEGSIQMEARIDGVLALGSIGLMVVPRHTAPAVGIDPDRMAVAGGLLRVTGSRLSANTELWLENRRLNVMSISGDGSALVAELPADVAGGSLYAISDGVRTASVHLQMGALERVIQADAIRVDVKKHLEAFVNFGSSVDAVTVRTGWEPVGQVRNYRAQVEALTVLSSIPGTGLIMNYRAFADPISVLVD